MYLYRVIVFFFCDYSDKILATPLSNRIKSLVIFKSIYDVYALYFKINYNVYRTKCYVLELKSKSLFQ